MNEPTCRTPAHEKVKSIWHNPRTQPANQCHNTSCRALHINGKYLGAIKKIIQYTLRTSYAPFFISYKNYLRHYHPWDSPHAKREWSCIYLIIAKIKCSKYQVCGFILIFSIFFVKYKMLTRNKERSQYLVWVFDTRELKLHYIIHSISTWSSVMLLLTGQKENTGNILSSHFNVIIQSNEFEFMFCYCYYYPIKCIRLLTVIRDSKHCHWKIITSTPTSARMGLTSFHLCRSCMSQAQLIDHFEITKVKKQTW